MKAMGKKGWFWRKKSAAVPTAVPGQVSPKLGAELTQIVKEAKELLQTKDGAVYTLQRKQIKNVLDLMKMMKNALSTINQFSLQTAEWAVEMNRKIKHFAEQAELTRQFNVKLLEYEHAYAQQIKGIQGFATKSAEEIQRQAPVRTRKRDEAMTAIKEINREIRVLRKDFAEFAAQASNIHKNITLAKKTCDNGLVNNAQILIGAADDLKKHIASTQGVYTRIQAKLKPLGKELETAAKDAEVVMARIQSMT